ncbi:MAG: glucose sorbosone dehydrogenase [Phycisphaerales bacterium]|nr:PQQ-dependent sugar dehydrogenase [Phycisphaerae bacterium]NNF42346.1 glucose sorbosone dehydrogenase [Phycisphaerales bacterium]NNM25806.1 glucose sorbosone dehydrogenase [Phycisphaerales bacterium]
MPRVFPPAFRRAMLSVAGGSVIATASCGGSTSEAVEANAPIVATGMLGDTEDIPTIAIGPAFPRLSFNRPIFLTHAGDERLFVVEQAGRILVFENRADVERTTEFLDIRKRVRMRHNEEGLLALAFDPAYATSGAFYVYYTASSPRRGVLSRFRVSGDDPNAADPASEEVILEVEQPYGNHNGATVLFGPDGMLYLSLGDGGWANDPHEHSQNLSTLLGTVLRLDVARTDGDQRYAIPPDNPFVGRDDARGEIWAYGLRNVWRMSFDRVTGDLWGGDVGQNRWEEIDLIVRGGNYGWNAREGKHPFGNSRATGDFIDPVAEYPRSEGISVTGGYVYRGVKHPDLVGVYLYADYSSGKVWGLRYENDTVTGLRQVSETGGRRVHVASFGEDVAGELYICGFDRQDGRTGRIHRVSVR